VKLYILIRDDVELGFALVAAAHASLAAYLRFKDHPDVAAWLAGPFRKVMCKVNAAEWDAAKELDDHVIVSESALGGREVALAFRPRAEWPKRFQFLRLYR
jgi:peptidyl-tRNA hydrolase